MPVEQAIWRIGQSLTRLHPARLAREIDLESYIEQDITILNNGWFVIGRQVQSDVGPIDLLAVDQYGSLILLELKRDLTSREVTAQALDYAAWVEGLAAEEIAGIYQNYCEKYQPKKIPKTFDEAFLSRFRLQLPEESLNQTHQIVLVASELDARTERIVRYLAGRGIEINILFFQVFADGDQRFLSRVWLLDAAEIEKTVSRNRSDSLGEWNGEYYVSFGLGEGEHRNWEDAVSYGFISAGGGSWYSSTLLLLPVGARVWVNIPGTGYAGVGRVIGPSQPARDFTVKDVQGNSHSILSIHKNREGLNSNADDPERSEYFVPVEWIKTVPQEKALKEVGFFGNQHSVCKPRTSKWTHTVNRLKQLFAVQ